MGLAFTAFWLDCAGSRKKTSGKLCESRAVSFLKGEKGRQTRNVYNYVDAFKKLPDKGNYLKKKKKIV